MAIESIAGLFVTFVAFVQLTWRDNENLIALSRLTDLILSVYGPAAALVKWHAVVDANKWHGH